MKTKFKTIPQICSLVNLIIAKKADKEAHQSLYFDLNNIANKNITYLDIVKLCDIILLMAKTKNRVIRYIEAYFWSPILVLSYLLIQRSDTEVTIDENEELLPNEAYASEHKKILSYVLGLCFQILNMKNDETQNSYERRSNALETIASLLNYYVIKGAKSLLLISIVSKDNKEQYLAFEALSNYYNIGEDELEEELIEKLNTLAKETDNQDTASSCLQILIDAGIINEFEAICRMDDWKNKNWGREYDDEDEDFE